MLVAPIMNLTLIISFKKEVRELLIMISLVKNLPKRQMELIFKKNISAIIMYHVKMNDCTIYTWRVVALWVIRSFKRTWKDNQFHLDNYHIITPLEVNGYGILWRWMTDTIYSWKVVEIWVTSSFRRTWKDNLFHLDSYQIVTPLEVDG